MAQLYPDGKDLGLHRGRPPGIEADRLKRRLAEEL
jgi:hypothetical protein